LILIKIFVYLCCLNNPKSGLTTPKAWYFDFKTNLPEYPKTVRLRAFSFWNASNTQVFYV